MSPDLTVTYTVSVTITRPARPDADDTLTDVVAWMVSPIAKRELEREVLRALKKLDGDCDAEVLETSIDGTPEPERDEAYERAAQRAEMDDFADTGGKDWR